MLFCGGVCMGRGGGGRGEGYDCGYRMSCTGAGGCADSIELLAGGMAVLVLLLLTPPWSEGREPVGLQAVGSGGSGETCGELKLLAWSRQDSRGQCLTQCCVPPLVCCHFFAQVVPKRLFDESAAEDDDDMAIEDYLHEQMDQDLFGDEEPSTRRPTWS